MSILYRQADYIFTASLFSFFHD
uniref:Uncharacterized protein n=1 Tax=Anguilla anguilla TaxID=7936 RepID=A0A0E9Q1H6_ANGAN